MPRGAPKGGNNNILNTTTATPAELSRLTGLVKDMFMAPLPDLHDEKQVYDAIMGYFNTCEARGIRPGNMGLYAALGMSRQDFNDVMRGANKSKVSPACIDMMKSAARAMSVYREGLANENKIHPTSYIFMSKNFDGMEDYTRIEVTADHTQRAQLTPEEVQKQIEQDIPIDSDYIDIDK